MESKKIYKQREVESGSAVCPHCEKPVTVGQLFFQTNVYQSQKLERPPASVPLYDVRPIGYVVTHFDCYRWRGGWEEKKPTA